jgi:hypothetical protein
VPLRRAFPNLDDVPQIVMAILAAVHQATKHWRPPWPTSIDEVVVSAEHAPLQGGCDIGAGANRMAFGAGGYPLHSVAITGRGIPLLESLCPAQSGARREGILNGHRH